MSRLARIDFKAATWLARLVNELRFFRQAKRGKHRSYGISTYEAVRMIQVAREC